MAESLLRVHLFGPFSLSNGDESAALSPRLQSLLAYLLIHRAVPQTRQQIAFLFWPETSDAQAQTNLRQLLHTLKRRFPNPEAYLRVDERTVGWRADAAYSLDVAIFENALGRAALAQGPAKIAGLEQAVAAYAGDLMPGCYDDWILPVRERLAQAYVGAMEQLVLLHEERRNHAAAIAHAQQLLRYDPLHEATYRRLMRLYALTGDRAAALRVYHTCASALERELDVAPSPATQEAYERLRQVDGALAQPRSARTPFVGRQTEWGMLQTLWRTVNRGGLRVVCVQGEAGLGKTRLAEELLHWAGQQGIKTLHSRAYAAEGGLAYAPVVEWLRSEILQPDLARLAPVWRRELARLLPELLAADPGLPAPEPLTELGQRQRLFEALGRALVPDDRALILVLDDLQWCDEETLTWLLYVAHHFAKARLLVLATQRNNVLDRDHPVTSFLVELSGLELLTELPLAPLDTGETTALAESIAEAKLDTAQADRLFAATEGNPLFVVETMRAQLASPGAPSSPLALPPKVHAVIQARLAQLSTPTRDSGWAGRGHRAGLHRGSADRGLRARRRERGAQPGRAVAAAHCAGARGGGLRVQPRPPAGGGLCHPATGPAAAIAPAAGPGPGTAAPRRARPHQRPIGLSVRTGRAGGAGHPLFAASRRPGPADLFLSGGHRLLGSGHQPGCAPCPWTRPLWSGNWICRWPCAKTGVPPPTFWAQRPRPPMTERSFCAASSSPPPCSSPSIGACTRSPSIGETMRRVWSWPPIACAWPRSWGMGIC